MSFSLPVNASLLLAFEDLPDTRKERNQLYPFIDRVAIASSAMEYFSSRRIHAKCELIMQL